MVGKVHYEAEVLLGNKEKDSLAEYQSWQAKSGRGHSRRYAWLFMMVLLLCSLSANVYQFTYGHTKGAQTLLWGNLKFDSPVIVKTTTEYQSRNHSLADGLWNSLDTSAAAVAIPDQWVKQHNLPWSERFPWDDTKGMYFVKGIHQVHCLKLLYRAVSNFYRYNKAVIAEPHILHCLDALRQDIMCYADDTPMLALPGKKLGDQQPLMCRNWDSLVEWAGQPLFEACWRFGDEYGEIEHRIERYQFCRENSEYYPMMKQFFEVHGHHNMYPEDPVSEYSAA